MSRELTKMNLIAIVQQLPKDDIEVIQAYISMIERENEKLNHYKKLYQILKREKDELRSWLEGWIENEEYCYLATTPKDRCRKDIYQDVLSKLNEIESGKNE